MRELSTPELAAQRAELLPARETLFFDLNVAPIVNVNVATAINALTQDTVAEVDAAQDVVSTTG